MLDLSQERWEQLDTLLDAALDRPANERTAYLRSVCGNDLPLYREVLSLLEGATRGETDLGESAASFAGPLLDDFASRNEPDGFTSGVRIGRYRIVRELGRGGMGTVYLAERADGAFEKQVALKLVQESLGANPVAAARFQLEREILAGLDHPGIARLLDAGTTDDHRPYFVMELVDGQPITKYADDRKLVLAQRLELVCEVAWVVAYAHRRLIVHRDLKPSNILIAEGESGSPSAKLLDFGIARLMDAGNAEADDRGSAAVAAETLRLTPVYAAPEQFRGEAATTATDVYALGVLLFELLSGKRPFDFSGKSVLEIATCVETHVPPAPSSATTDPRQAKNLRGDLDAIVLKALERQPADRYASVDALLDDIIRHQTGLPVRARASSASYRFRKFVSRHRAGAVATALVAASLLGGLSMALWQARAKTLEARRAEAVTAFVLDLFEQADPSVAQGEVFAARDLVAQGADRVRANLGEQPEVQAEMLGVLGDVYLKLGDYENARALLEESIALHKTEFGPTHERTADVLDQLGQVEMELARFDLADSLLNVALNIRRARLGNQHNDVAETLTHLGTLRGSGRQERMDEAEAFHRESFEIRQAILDPDDPDLLRSLRGLSSVLFDEGQYAEAEPLLRDLLARQQRVLGERHPESLRTMVLLMRTIGNRMQNLDDAVALGRRAVPLAKQVWGDEHSDTADIIQAYSTVLINRHLPEDVDTIEALEREALAIRRATLGDEHPVVAESMGSLALVLKGLGRTKEAVELARDAADLERRTRGNETRSLVIYQDYLAKALYEDDQYDEADRVFDEAYELGVRTWPTDHLILADLLVHHGQLLQEQGRIREAEPKLNDGLRIAELHLPPTHDMIGTAKLRLGLCFVARNEYEQAEPLLLAALANYEVSAPDAGAPIARQALVELYEAWGQPDKASRYR